MENVLIQLPSQAQIDIFEVKMMVAGGLYEKGKLSSGQAAEMVGLSKRSFLEFLGKYGFSIFGGYNAEDLESDLKTLHSWKKL